MFSDIEGKVVVVTGAAMGIGRAAALEFGRLDAKVVVSTAHNVKAGEEVAAEIREAGGEAIFSRCNVTVEAEVEQLVAKAVETFGRIDCAFNNAGIGPDGVRIGFCKLVELEGSMWDKIMEVNAKGVFLCMKHEIRQMLKHGGGVIVNTASIGGLRLKPNFGAYGPSKAAVIAVSKLAAAEYAQMGIRVNVVCPGPTMGTELVKNSIASNYIIPGKGFGASIPLGKMGELSDVVNAVIWLCSGLSGHVTGHALTVDGGAVDVG